MAYNKPILTEMYAEIHLDPEVLTEARYFDVVPKLRSLGFTEIELARSGMSLEVKQGRAVPREKQRVRCWNPARTQLVQVAEDLLIVNLTGSYPGWDSFVDLFKQGLSALDTGLGVYEIRSLQLATIDTFEVPKASYSISDYLNVGGPIIPAWYAGCDESLDFDLGHGLLEADGHNRQVHANVKTANDPVRISFRAEFHDAIPKGKRVLDVLSELHVQSNDTFEALITDKVRIDVMGGHRQ